jgi:hypothetical protein
LFPEIETAEWEQALMNLWMGAIAHGLLLSVERFAFG